MNCQKCGERKAVLSLCEECLEIPLCILRAFGKEEVEQIWSETCELCGRTFLEFLLAAEAPCPACDEPFSKLLRDLLGLILKRRLAEPRPRIEARASKTFRFPWSKPEPPQPALSLAQMKERLEALIYDERYEEAGKLEAEIKNLVRPK